MSADVEATKTMPTRRDLIEGNFDRVFAKEIEEEEVSAPAGNSTTAAVVPFEGGGNIPARPDFGAEPKDFKMAKALSMCGAMIPDWLRGNAGACFGVVQLSKRWTRYSHVTKSWVHFDPMLVAQNTYLVESGDKVSVNYLSQMIRALIDYFASVEPLEYKWNDDEVDEPGDLTCTVTGVILRGGQRFTRSYTTPPVRTIHPKKSPLWASDPKRQLAYYGSRAWTRLYAAGVLLGVSDIEDMPEDAREVVHVRDLGDQAAEPVRHIVGLAERLRKGRAEADPLAEPAGGYREGHAAKAINGDDEKRAGKPKGAKKAAKGSPGKGKPAKRITSAPTAPHEAVKPTETDDSPKTGGEMATKQALEQSTAQAVAQKPQRPAPKTLAEYTEHVRAWIMTLNDEQSIEERFAGERKLRNLCQVTSEDKARIRAEIVDQRILDLRGRA